MPTLIDRFNEVWAVLAPIGRHDGTGGYRRFAWTAEDAQMRQWFAAQAQQRGLRYEVDRNGNQWAWWGEPGQDALVTGSHLDSVPDGGAFDGPLGVVSAFLAIDELVARGITPTRPVAVTNFADEEGARFGVACMGSQLITGAMSPERARGLSDADGITLEQAMRDAGIDPFNIGRDDVALDRIGAFIELHVEQGRALIDMDDVPVCAATSIVPHGRWRFSFAGEANHAGTTLLADRSDPTLPYSACIPAAREAADRVGAVATFGKVRILPNGANAIPSQVDAWLDTRAADDATVESIVAEITETAEKSALAHGVTVTVTQESYSPIVNFDAELTDRVSAILGGVPKIPTGAGHDAGILSHHVRAAMLFVRNPTGVSHSPVEFAESVDCVAGIEALAKVLEELACQ